jgi:hypothetical protein
LLPVLICPCRSAYGPELVISGFLVEVSDAAKVAVHAQQSVLTLSADSVEKLGAWVVILATACHLARGDLLDMPSSVQMMGFAG